VYPIGVHVIVVEDLEDRPIGSPILFMGQKGKTVAVVADKQVILEAVIERPSGLDELFFHLFSLHFLPLSSTPSFPRFFGAEVLCHPCSFR
jgi:hypothetical protein